MSGMTEEMQKIVIVSDEGGETEVRHSGGGEGIDAEGRDGVSDEGGDIKGGDSGGCEEGVCRGEVEGRACNGISICVPRLEGSYCEALGERTSMV